MASSYNKQKLGNNMNFIWDTPAGLDSAPRSLYNLKLKSEFIFKLERPMKKLIFFLMLLMMAALPAAAEPTVIATNFPLYDFARQVAGEAAQVSMLIPPGTEVHAYDPTPKDMIAVEQCDLLLYVGGESEGWVDTLLSATTDGPDALKLMDSVEAMEEADHEDHHGDEAYDEHIWTSPVNAMRMVQAIADGLARQDPENTALYQANAQAYIDEIAGLDASFRDVVANGSRKLLVFADRFPLAYFAHEYGLDVIAAFPGCSGETEPSAQVMRQLIDTVRKDGVPCVYTIEMSTGRVAETVREETGCEVAEFHSCQNVTKDELEAGETYVSLMRKNLAALELGLR